MDGLIVSAAEFQQNFGRYEDEAMAQPVTITRDGRERLVVLSAEEYARLKRRDRVVRKSEDLTDAELDAITESGMDPRHNHLNAELE